MKKRKKEKQLRQCYTLWIKFLGAIKEFFLKEFFKKASYNVVKWPPIEKVEKERRSLSSLAVFCGGYPHLFMLPA